MNKKSRRNNTLDFNFVPDDIISYNRHDFLSFICSADETFNRFRYDSITMFNLIKNGIYDLKKVYIKEDSCLCNIGLGVRPYVNTHKCNGCSLIRNICTGYKLPNNRIIEIMAGKHEGKKIEVIEYNNDIEEYERDFDTENILIKMLKKENKFCLLDDSLVQYYNNITVYNTNSYITNYIIASIFLNNKMMKYKIPNTVLFEWFFSCANKVKIIKPIYYNFTDINKIEVLNKNLKSPTAQTKISPLNEKAVVSIIKQLTVILHFYNKYSLVHGRPSIEYIQITNNSCNYKYGDIIVDSPVTLHIDPSFYTSFNFENDKGEFVRLNSKIINYNINLLEYPIKKVDILISPISRSVPDNNTIPLIQSLRSHFVYCYKIGEKISNFTNLQTYYGIPLLQGSFEFYCFIICLLYEDSFYTTFMENYILKNIWIGMWRDSEYEDMNRELQNLKTRDVLTHEDVISFVSNYYLRVDIIKYFYDNMIAI
jgi:hypothetical protein